MKKFLLMAIISLGGIVACEKDTKEDPYIPQNKQENEVVNGEEKEEEKKDVVTTTYILNHDKTILKQWLDNSANEIDFTTDENLKNIKTISEDAFREATALKKIVLNEGLEKIECTFHTSEALESVTLPQSLKHIGGYAFGRLSLLKSIHLPEGLEKIGDDAFFGSGLEEITIPKSVKEIPDSAFALCKSLRKVTL